jgi:hypothetical protein
VETPLYDEATPQYDEAADSQYATKGDVPQEMESPTPDMEMEMGHGIGYEEQPGTSTNMYIFMGLGAVIIGVLIYIAYFYFTYNKFPWDNEATGTDSTSDFIKLPWSFNNDDKNSSILGTNPDSGAVQNPYSDNPYLQ